MKKFAFRLEPLLKIRAEKTSDAKEALGQAVQLRLLKERSIAEKRAYSLDVQKRSGFKNSVSVQDLQASFQHVRAVAEEIAQLEKECSQITEIETLRRELLSEAMKQEKVLDKLKEKKKVQFHKDLLKEESALLEEIAQRKTARL
jgi:flagellar FliJ protein